LCQCRTGARAAKGAAIRRCHADLIAVLLKTGHHRIRHQFDHLVLVAGIEQYVM
jgi:hypothetical protein